MLVDDNVWTYLISLPIKVCFLFLHLFIGLFFNTCFVPSLSFPYSPFFFYSVPFFSKHLYLVLNKHLQSMIHKNKGEILS